MTLPKLALATTVGSAVVLAACTAPGYSDDMAGNDTIDKDAPMMAVEDTMMDDIPMVASSTYADYTPERFAELQGSEPMVLFFHASWCPSCRSVDADLTAAGDMVGGQVLKVDFDSSDELKREYGVTTQHTFVEFAADGTHTTRAGGGAEEIRAFFASTGGDDMAKVDMMDDAAETVAVADMADKAGGMMKVASYEEYSPDRFAALQGSEPVALFFHASWCGKCRALEEEIQADVAAVGGAVLVADYDAQEELKREYGVTTQHTVVFFSADGTVAEKQMGAKLADLQSFFAGV